MSGGGSPSTTICWSARAEEARSLSGLRLVPFSPRIAPPERSALRDGSKPRIAGEERDDLRTFCKEPLPPRSGGGAKGCGASWVQIRIGGGGRGFSSLLGVLACRPVRGAVDGMTSPVRRLARGGAASAVARRLPEHLLALARGPSTRLRLVPLPRDAGEERERGLGLVQFGQCPGEGRRVLRGSLALKGRAHSRADGFHQGLEMVFGRKRATLARATHCAAEVRPC